MESFKVKENQLRDRLKALEEEKEKILQELVVLENQNKSISRPAGDLKGVKALNRPPETNDEKVKLFLDLFRCRQDVFPKYWENSKNGKKGYSPVCLNEWQRLLCDKPKIKCSDCKSQKFARLDSLAVENHLKGLQIIGTYSILENDSCTFLACDFDEESWQRDVFLYKEQAAILGVETLVERSRSGNGAHAWIFFSEAIPARLARSLGTLILSKCIEANHNISLKSYDRFFPNQDCLPEGGFGNLIALPLQRIAREKGNSLFVNNDLVPVADQWKTLSEVRRVGAADVRALLEKFQPEKVKQNDVSDNAMLVDEMIFSSESSPKSVNLDMKEIIISLGGMIRIPIEGLPSRLITSLKKTSSFANPEFYKRQRMRMSTYEVPRFLFSGELTNEEIILPRGVLDKVKEILRKAKAQVVISEERAKGKKLKISFKGELRGQQSDAVAEIFKSDIGVLQAPPGAGKTVMACSLIAKRKVATLILVHRQPLVDQWKERLESFLDLKEGVVGIYTGTKKKLKGQIDIAMLPSLSKFEELDELVEKYGQVIIDEVHHIPAASFEGVLKRFKAKYVTGLSATPYRKDGLDRIIFQQCGPIRFKMDSPDGGLLLKTVFIKETGFKFPAEVGEYPAYTVFSDLIAANEKRNELIASDLLTAVNQGRFPLVISDRKEQLTKIQELLLLKESQSDRQVFRLDGELSSKQRKEVLKKVEEARVGGDVAVIFATASLIGEGFDLPELDTLILASPLSFEGRLVQYAGRLHRIADGKTGIEIYDYVESACGVSYKMYKNRIRTYKKMEYQISAPMMMFGGN